ncbi:bifunctional diguanylate cyclase/phosphodiesterase [Amphritea sp. HPY]|uniref:bifunctional diguanylate cyclase/phosphodiesterase n=1 Tax=Amphritea sp. HPY TaxID=3421652 RepID=UPI003D7C7DCB
MLKLNNKNKLLYSIMSLLLLGLIASTFVAYKQVSDNMLSSLQNEQLLQANTASDKLSQWLNGNLNTITSLADTLSQSSAPIRDNPRYEFYLQQTFKATDFFYLYYGLEDGYSWFTDWNIPAGYDPRLRPWYIASKQAQKPHITAPYLGVDEYKQMYVAITAPIVKDGQFSGVISGDLTLDFVRQTVLDIKLDMGGFAFLAERNGNILIHPDTSRQDSNIDNLPGLSEYPAGSLLQSTNKTLFNTQDYLYCAFPIDASDWYLVFTIPKLVINSVIVSKTLNLLAYFLAIFTTVLILFYTLNRRLLTPLMDFLQQDTATGLPNKKLFKQQVSDQYLTHSQNGMLLIISTDDFNQLTAAYPATVINELQKRICNRIETCLNQKTVLGVFSESRFIAYLPNTEQLEERDRILQLQALNDSLSRVYLIAQHKLNCSIRIGASFYPQHGDNIEVLIDKAFSVMALAKKQRKTDINIYTPDIDSQLSNDLLIASAMRNALRKQEFHMVYQPQYDLATGQFSSLEALIRWNSAELQRTVSPYEFIPVAEASDLIIELSYSVIEMVACQIRSWANRDTRFDRVSINISPKQLQQNDFQNQLQSILKRHSVSPSEIELEITETSLLEDPENSIYKLEQLKDAGFSIAIDDFGTGYSSMQYLTTIPFSKLKIDRAFVSDLEDNQKNQLIVKMLSDMAQALNFTLLAEGAETQAQADLLAEIGCHMIQGYFYAKPMPVDQLESFIHNATRLENA